MPADLKITTELLYKGALIFAMMDAVFIPLLVWFVPREDFRRVKWSLVIAAALIWYGIWNWAIGNFWETVYSYLFPAWAQMWTPWIAFIAAGTVAHVMWMLTVRIKQNQILAYCLLSGIMGSLTHIWAVYRGVVTKPPMLQGASPFGAVTIAFFEYMFYWCIILLIAKLMDWIQRKIIRPIF